MSGPNDFLPRRVRNSLHESDNNLRISGVGLLKIEVAEALCERDIRTLLPKDLLRIAVQFYRKLNVAAARVAEAPSSLDFRHPYGPCRFRKTDDLIVAFHDESPIWFWERLGQEWSLNSLNVRISRHDRDPLWDASWLEDPRLYHAPDGNDPRGLTPGAFVGVIWYVKEILDRAVASVDGRPYIPDVSGLSTGYVFRTDGEFTVAYRPLDEAPAWCWKRKCDGMWKLYRMQPERASRLPDLSQERELRDGEWLIV